MRPYGTRVYVGGLKEEIKKEDLEREMNKYGKLNWVAINPLGFAFIEFKNFQEAEGACSAMNGTEMLGATLKVELSRRKYGRRRNDENFKGSEVNVQDPETIPSHNTGTSFTRDNGGINQTCAKKYGVCIRISNLSETTSFDDLAAMVQGLGPVKKRYLGLDKSTGQCKGFAFVCFKFLSDAEKAIQKLNGQDYEHLNLKVEFHSKQKSNKIK